MCYYIWWFLWCILHDKKTKEGLKEVFTYKRVFINNCVIVRLNYYFMIDSDTYAKRFR